MFRTVGLEERWENSSLYPCEKSASVRISTKKGYTGARYTMVSQLPDLCLHSYQGLQPPSLCKENFHAPYLSHSRGWPWQNASADISYNRGLSCSWTKEGVSAWRAVIHVQPWVPQLYFYQISFHSPILILIDTLLAKKSDLNIWILKYIPLYSAFLYDQS